MKSAASAADARRRTSLVVLITGALLVACCFGTIGKAKATLDGTLMRFGSDALAFPGMLPSPSGTIRINGIDVSYRVEAIEKPLADVWEHYGRSCGRPTKGSGAIGTLIRALASRGASSEKQAYVACVDLKRDDLPSVIKLAEQLAQTWDLSRLGALRYVYAQRDASEPTRTLLFSMWVDGSFDLRSFVLHGDKDSPGADLRFVPRPLASHRVLSMERPPHALALYRVPRANPEEQARWYTRHLRSNGWLLADMSKHGFVEVDGTLLVVAENGSRSATVAISVTEGGSTLVSIVEAEVL